MRTYLFIISFIITSLGCGVYSFSGASIPKDVKTISIDYIQNRAPNAWTTTDRIFNQELRNKLVRESGLRIVDENGDYSLRGSIVSYAISPQTATQGQLSSAYRLDITVQIEFKDNISEKKREWNRTFANSEVFEGDITGTEDQRITRISNAISTSIFNEIFSTW